VNLLTLKQNQFSTLCHAPVDDAINFYRDGSFPA